MDDTGQVPVPRALRVGGTLQVLGKRLPIKTAVIGIVLMLLWGIISFAGADMVVTAEVLLVAGAIASVLVEGRWDGGYDTFTILRDVARVLREPRYLDWRPELIEVAAERSAQRPTSSTLRLRWQATEDRSQEK